MLYQFMLRGPKHWRTQACFNFSSFGSCLQSQTQTVKIGVLHLSKPLSQPVSLDLLPCLGHWIKLVYRVADQRS